MRPGDGAPHHTPVAIHRRREDMVVLCVHAAKAEMALHWILDLGIGDEWAAGEFRVNRDLEDVVLIWAGVGVEREIAIFVAGLVVFVLAMRMCEGRLRLATKKTLGRELLTLGPYLNPRRHSPGSRSAQCCSQTTRLPPPSAAACSRRDLPAGCCCHGGTRCAGRV